MHILLLEDDRRLAAVARWHLTAAQHTVDVAYDGAAGQALALSGHHDVIVLDGMMPQQDGLEICRQLRAAGVVTPILMYSARQDVDAVVDSFDAGADDYLVTPYAPEEFLARVHALGRRSALHMAAPGRVAGAAHGDALPRAAPRPRWLARHLHAWAASMHRLSPGR